MSKDSSEKVSRRDFLKLTGAGVIGLAVGSVLGWALKPAELREVTSTVTIPREVTITAPAVRKLPKDTIKIGVLGIRSGLWATYGEFIEQGARMAAEEINARGGVLGAKIELTFRDEQADVVK